MTPVFHHYTKWEDWQAGMYQAEVPEGLAPNLTAAARMLLADAEGLWIAMSAVIEEWRHAAEQNLTHAGRNGRAWLGQAACCYAEGVPADLTKLAWWTLSNDERRNANAVADQVIARWRAARTGLGLEYA